MYKTMTHKPIKQLFSNISTLFFLFFAFFGNYFTYGETKGN